MKAKQKYILFIALTIIVLVLIFPETTFGGIIPPGGGCKTQATIGYRTECPNEYKSVGSCKVICCEWECCEWDEE
ncbi:MAG: hypothetical protein COZ89_03330, partial [Candidatus Nealsonbacteria bacterium CG_4_8_14_3_um_filter_37_23]